MIGKRLKELRKEKGWTLEQAGARIGLRKSSYASYETKYRRPTMERLNQLSNLYGVSVDYLLGLSDERIGHSDRNIRTVFEKKGLHWDGIPLEEDVLVKILDVLKEASVIAKLDKEG
ncbi:helix-turn-helix domain-containing protein [Neobacillus niacini]|uniref:helix-turn-helix domain-containing protein n=1 Tax=Neobacillus niacini TaxID=86668 RepID=UPI003983C3AE